MEKFTVKTCKTVRLTFGITLSVYTVILGALFIWQILDIYLGGVAAGLTSPFDYMDVKSRTRGILAAPFWIWIALIFVGLILFEIFPVKRKRQTMDDPVYILNRLKKRLPKQVSEDLKDSFDFVKREERTLLILKIICLLAGVAGCIYSVIYLATPSNFPNVDKTADMLNLALHVLTFAAAVFIIACGVAYFEAFSAKRQLPYVKKLIAGTKPPAVTESKISAFFDNKYFILGVRVAVLCVGVAFIIAGALNGSVSEVFNKAIRICTECIGLG